MRVTRLTFFLDLAAEDHAAATAFWQAATGYALSASRGEHDEFASLLPSAGADHLRLQRLADGPSRTHLDVHVDDLAQAEAQAVSGGATVLSSGGHVSLLSPGGYPFCLVTAPAAEPSPPTTWPHGHRSRAEQLCLDIGPSAYEAECAFWAALTSWPTRTAGSEFTRLRVPEELGTRLLLQRLEQDEGAVRGHLDVATDDRPAEVARLQALGATTVRENDEWTVLCPPAGPVLCVTDRDPVTGLSG
ncbi:MAG: VOC family protein [Nocardioides sp.]